METEPSNSNNPLISISSFLLKPLLENITIASMQEINCISSYESLFNILLQMTSSEGFQVNFTSIPDRDYFLETFSYELMKVILGQKYIIGQNGDEIALHIINEYLHLFLKYIDDPTSGVYKLIDTMRLVFDFNSNYYKGSTGMNALKRVGREAIERKTCSYEQFNYEIFDRRDFIETLTVGKEIDVRVNMTVKSNYSYSHHNVWVRGVIQAINLPLMTLSVTVPSGRENLEISLQSLEYAESGKFTKDYDWRKNLQPYDVIKCYNEEREHYVQATIIERRADKAINSVENVVYRVGFRIYSNASLYPEYSKRKRKVIDSLGKECIGDLENHDQYIPFYSKFIIKWDCLAIDDDFYSYDSIIPFKPKSSIPNYVIGKKQFFFYYNNMMLQRFSILHGYEKLISLLEDDSPIKNCDYIIELIRLLTEILIQTRMNLHHDYMKELCPRIKKMFAGFLCNEKIVKTFKKEYIDYMYIVLHFFLAKGCPGENNDLYLGRVFVLSSFELLKTDVLEKRLMGMKKITELLQTPEGEIYQELLGIIQKNDVLSLIFGNNSHNQLIIKSQELVEVLTKKKLLTNQDINAIWLGTKNGDLQSKLSIMTLLKNVCPYFERKSQKYLLKLIFADNSKSISSEEIELIKINDKHGEECFDYLMNMLFFLPAEDEEKFEAILYILIYMITLMYEGENKDNSIIKIYDKCAGNLKENSKVHVTLIIMSRMIQEKLIVDNDQFREMMQLFSESCDKYKERHIKGGVDIDIRDIKQRLSFALLLYQHDPHAFRNMIQLMFEFLVVTGIAPKEFYEWTLNIISIKDKPNKSESIINTSILSIYTTLIMNNKSLLRNMPLIGLEAFIKIFMQSNKQNIQFLCKGNEEKVYYEIVASTIPIEQLVGFDIFFNIIRENKEETIVNQTFQFLFTSYQNLNDLNTLLNKSISMFNKSTDDIPKLFNILTLMIEESEMKGIPVSIRQHNSIRKLAMLSLTIDSLITIDPLFIVTVFQTTTVWELKKIITKKIAVNEDFLELSYGNNLIISQDSNGKSLLEFQLENYSIIQVSFNEVNDEIQKTPLAVSREEMAPELKAILNQWYSTFANNEEVMDKNSCVRFIQHLINTKDTIHPNDSRVEALMSSQCNKEEYLPRNAFMTFFSSAALSVHREESIRDNLRNMLIRNDLKPMTEAYNSITEDKSYYPRWSLAQNETFFQQLLSYEPNDDDTKSLKVMQDMIGFMNKLCTNDLVYGSIKNFDNEEVMKMLMNDRGKYSYIKLSYVLSIIEHFIEDYDDELTSKENDLSDNNSPKDDSHLKWLNHFLDRKGYQFLINVFDIKSTFNHSIETNVINSLLRIMRIIYDLFLRKLSSKNKGIANTDDNTGLYPKIENAIKQHNLIDYLIPLLNKEININVIDLLLNTISFGDETQYKEMISKVNQSNILNILIEGLNMNSKLLPILSKFIKINSEMKRYDIIALLFIEMFKQLNNTLSKEKTFAKHYYEIFGELYYEYLGNKSKMANGDDSHLKEYDDYFNMIAIILREQLSYNNKDMNVISNDELIGYFTILSKAITYSNDLKLLLTDLIPILLNQIHLTDASKDLQTINDSYINPDDFIKKHHTYRMYNPSIRKVFFDFIITLITNSSQNMQKLLLLLSSLSQPSPSLVKESRLFEPSNRPKENGYIGLRNPGCICYMNSILQQFYMIPTLRYAIMTNDDYLPEKRVSSFMTDDNFYHQIQKMFSYLNFSLRKDYHPIEFCHSFKDYDGQPTNINAQQDSNEFLSQFIEKMENSLKSTPLKYLTDSTFKGHQCTQLECTVCSKGSNRYEEFNYLSLEVKNMKTINDSLKKLISEETIDGYDCETCAKKVSIKKRNLLSNLPNVLMFYLQRIYYDYETDMNKKINSRWEFPKVLNMKPYTIESQSNCKENNDEVYSKNDEYYEYHLVGVNVHLGRSDGGHYFSYINTSREGDSESNEMKLNMNDWIQFNDDHIGTFDIKKLEENCFGGKMKREDSSFFYMKDCIQSAYMLIYERRIKSPLKVLLQNQPEILSNKTLISITPTNSFRINRQYSIFTHLNDDSKKAFLSQLYNDLIFYDTEKKEHFKYSPFYSHQRLLSKKYFIEISQDNIQFQRHLNTSDEHYHSFINTAISSFITTIFTTVEGKKMDTKVMVSFLDFIFKSLSTKPKAKVLASINWKICEGIKNADNDLIKLLTDYYIENRAMVWSCLVNSYDDISVIHCDWLYEILAKMIENSKKPIEEFTNERFMLEFLLHVFNYLLNACMNDMKKYASNLVMTYGRIIIHANGKLLQYYITKGYVAIIRILLLGNETKPNDSYELISAYSLPNINELIKCLAIILLKTKEYNDLNMKIKMSSEDNQCPLIILSNDEWIRINNEQIIHLIYKYTPEYFPQIVALFNYKYPHNYLGIAKEIMSALYTMTNTSKINNIHTIISAISYITQIEGIDSKIKKSQLESMIGYEQVCFEENSLIYGFPSIGYNISKSRGKRAYAICSLVNKRLAFSLYEALAMINNKITLLGIIEHILRECTINRCLYDYIRNIHLDEWGFYSIVDFAQALMDDMKRTSSEKNMMTDYAKLEESIKELSQSKSNSNIQGKEEQFMHKRRQYLMNNIHKEEWVLLERKSNVSLIQVNYYVDYIDITKNSQAVIIKNTTSDADADSDIANANDLKSKEENVISYTSEERHSIDRKVIALIESDLVKNKRIVFTAKNYKGSSSLCLIRYIVFNNSLKDLNITFNLIPINKKDYSNEYIPSGDIVQKVNGNSSKTLLSIFKHDPHLSFSFDSLKVNIFNLEQLAEKENYKIFQVIHDSNNRYGSVSYKDFNNHIESDDD